MKFYIPGSKLGALALALGCLTITVQGQTSDGRPQHPEPARSSTPSIFDPMRPDPLRAPSGVSNPRTARPGGLPSPPRRALTEEHKRRLYPTAEERQRFATFLSQPQTGLMRLLPHSKCGTDPRVFEVGNACLDAIPPVPGGGSYYSFGSSEHQSARFADVWLKDGIFHAGVAGDALGVLTALGDVPLESVTLQNARVAYLAHFAPPVTVAEAERQYARSKIGFNANGHAYGVAAQVRPDTTYVLRSIIYKTEDSFNRRRKATDLLVAFRVVRKAEDGSVTLIWRELQRSKPPKLKI